MVNILNAHPGTHRHKDHNRRDPEIERDDRNFHRQNELFFSAPLVHEAEEPSGEEGSEQQRCHTAENQEECREELGIENGELGMEN